MVAPVFFLLVFGIFEFGRMVMVQQIVTNAAREGARRGILEQSTATEVRDNVTAYLASTTVSGATVTLSPDPLTEVGFGDPVTVTVSVPFADVSWLPGSWFLGKTNLIAVSTMNGERPE